MQKQVVLLLFILAAASMGQQHAQTRLRPVDRTCEIYPVGWVMVHRIGVRQNRSQPRDILFGEAQSPGLLKPAKRVKKCLTFPLCDIREANMSYVGNSGCSIGRSRHNKLSVWRKSR